MWWKNSNKDIQTHHLTSPITKLFSWIQIRVVLTKTISGGEIGWCPSNLTTKIKCSDNCATLHSNNLLISIVIWSYDFVILWLPDKGEIRKILQSLRFYFMLIFQNKTCVQNKNVKSILWTNNVHICENYTHICENYAAHMWESSVVVVFTYVSISHICEYCWYYIEKH